MVDQHLSQISSLVKKCPKKFAYKINVIWESCQSHARMDLGTEIATGTACMLLTTYNTDEHLFQNPPKAKLTTFLSFYLGNSKLNSLVIVTVYI